MKYSAPVPVRDTQCSHIVQPGEFLIDRWDNQRCEEKRHVVECLICFKWYCTLFHWGPHSMTHAE